MAHALKVILQGILSVILAFFSISMLSSFPALFTEGDNLITTLFVIAGILFAIYPIYSVYEFIKYFKSR